MANSFFLEQLMNDPNALIRVVSSGQVPGTVKGYVTQDFNFSGQADWENKGASVGTQDTMNSVFGGMQRLYNTAANAISGNSGMTAQKKLQSSAQTIESWSSTPKPTIQINFYMISTRPEHDVRKDAIILYGGVFPKVANLAGMVAPNGYGASMTDATGTYDIYIGKWFKAPKCVCQNVDIQFSREVIGSGTPLYAMVNASYIPYILPDISDIQGWLSGSNGM